jgi:hypothetical protein
MNRLLPQYFYAVIFSSMNAVLTADGKIALPEELRQDPRLNPGDRLEVQRAQLCCESTNLSVLNNAGPCWNKAIHSPNRPLLTRSNS